MQAVGRTPLVLQLEDKSTAVDRIDGPGPPPLWDEDCRIPIGALYRVLQGVAVATKSSTEDVERVKKQIRCMQQQHTSPDDSTLSPHSDGSESAASYATATSYAYTLHECLHEMLQNVPDTRTEHLCTLVTSVAYLRQHSRDRQDLPIPTETMNIIWTSIHKILSDTTLTPPLCTTVRSAQGFLSVNLSSIIESGNISELIRLHVWLPDGKRGKPEFKVHSHQPFAQSYVLAGTGTDISYTVTPASTTSTSTSSPATHAEYTLTWSGTNPSSSSNSSTTTHPHTQTYKTHQTSSSITNTGRLVTATPNSPVTHTRNSTYTVPHAHYHTTVVSPDSFHATFFFFDAARGFEKHAPVLGPPDGTTFTQLRDSAGITAAEIVGLVDAVRRWEGLVEEARACVDRGELEVAVEALERALKCVGLPETGTEEGDGYRDVVMRVLGDVERRIRKGVSGETRQ